jgi:hypothetical protein
METKPKKDQVVYTNKRLDMRDTTGPDIPKGTRLVILHVYRGINIGYVRADTPDGVGPRWYHVDDLTVHAPMKKRPLSKSPHGYPLRRKLPSTIKGWKKLLATKLPPNLEKACKEIMKKAKPLEGYVEL